MVKSNRLITLDVDINEKLKDVDNASALVNELLHGHFNAHQSNDIKFLSDKVEEYDAQMKQISFTRDSMAEKVKILSEKAKDHQETQEAKNKIDSKKSDYGKWLAEKVKAKELDFEDYRIILHTDNFEDICEQIMDGKLDLQEVAERLRPKAEDLNSVCELDDKGDKNE